MSDPIVVVGGGISGLATAYHLRHAIDPAPDVIVLEADGRIGGKIRTVPVAGLPVDSGPDAFLARSPDIRALIAALGLADDVHGPVQSGASVWSRGRLRPLPPGAAFGLPERLWPLVRSGLLSPTGALRAAADLVLPTSRLPADPSVGDLVRPRFGPQVHDRLVAPLLGGVHAGDPDLLSAAASAPDVAALARGSRSLTLAVRARKAAAPPPPPGGRPAPLVSLRDGLGRLIEALADDLGADRIHAATPVRRIERATGGGLVVVTDTGRIPAARVVLATPAHVTAGLLESLVPPAAALLRGIAYVDVANATLAFPADRVPPLPPGTGFLVPPAENEFVVGCSLLSGKWPHLAGHDVVLVRCMVGRFGDDRWLAMTDEQIVSGIRDALRRMVGITAEPVDTLVTRWPAAMPQYVVGHGARVARIEGLVEEIPGLHVTGAAFRGVGLASCVAQARALAERIATEAGR